MTSEVFNKNLREACRDYFYLLNRNYSRKSILKLVSDRNRLNSFQRIVLYRGIMSCEEVQLRKKKRLFTTYKSTVSIDMYNILLTIANYLYGRILFISNDGFLRDAGEASAKILSGPKFDYALKLFVEYITNSRFDKINLYLDQPVSYSGELAYQLNSIFADKSLNVHAETVKSPDKVLKVVTEGVICTSDSAIIDQAESKTFDLAKSILTKNFHPKFIKLYKYLNQ